MGEKTKQKSIGGARLLFCGLFLLLSAIPFHAWAAGDFLETDAVVLNLTQTDFAHLIHKVFQEEIDHGIHREKKDDPKRGFYGVKWSARIRPPRVQLEPGGEFTLIVDVDEATYYVRHVVTEYKKFDLDCSNLEAEIDPQARLSVSGPFRFEIDGDLNITPELPTIQNKEEIRVDRPRCTNGNGKFAMATLWHPLIKPWLLGLADNALLRSVQKRITGWKEKGFMRRKVVIKSLEGEDRFPLWIIPQRVSTDDGSFFLSLSAGTEEKPAVEAVSAPRLAPPDRSYFAMSMDLINRISQRFFQNLNSYPIPLKNEAARAVAAHLFDEAEELKEGEPISIHVDLKSPPRVSVESTPSGNARIHFTLKGLKISLDTPGVPPTRWVEQVKVTLVPYIGPLGLAWDIAETEVVPQPNGRRDWKVDSIRTLLQEGVFAQLSHLSKQGISFDFLRNENGEKSYFEVVGNRLMIDLNRTGAFSLQSRVGSSQAKR